MRRGGQIPDEDPLGWLRQRQDRIEAEDKLIREEYGKQINIRLRERTRIVQEDMFDAVLQTDNCGNSKAVDVH